MLVLALDTTTRVCSVALLESEENTLLAEYTQNIKKTHSQRLLPLIDDILEDTSTDIGALGAIAVAAGPGSFTGLRIGVSTARGLAQGLNIPAVGVSTLEALAGNLATLPGELICPILDARRDQVYAALYRCCSKQEELRNDIINIDSDSEGASLTHSLSENEKDSKTEAPSDNEKRSNADEGAPYNNVKGSGIENTGGVVGETYLKNLLEPVAISITELLAEIQLYSGRVFFPGDGIFKYAPFLHEQLKSRYGEVPPAFALNRASAVARCALRRLNLAEAPAEEFSPYHLQPYYLRLPEAEQRKQQQCREQEVQ